MTDDPRPLVLIAEDEPITRMALREQLEALDYRTLGPARDGDDAFALGACFPVDLGLFDLGMPGRSGLQAAGDLFALAPTPVVLLTGFDAADLPDPLPSPPIFTRLTKPVGLAELGTALENALARFRNWCAAHPDVDRLAAAGHRQRTTIARAVHAFADGRAPAVAASDFLDLARSQQRSPLDLARSILGEE